MAARLKIIRIPRTPASAFDQYRPASDLVRNQVRYAHQELHAWWKDIGSIAPEQLETEQQAADYLNKVTRVLHPEATQRTALPGNRQSKSGVVLGPDTPSPQRSSPRKPRTARRRG